MKPGNNRYVAYYRVSTRKQEASGLGLDAQQEAVNRFADGRGAVVASFTEVESGRRCDRPQLAAARDACHTYRATLLVAKLDRLSRDVELIANLMKLKNGFIACDMPDADPFRLHIEASIAQEEGRKISQRTKAALAAAKARGVKLGGARPGAVITNECRNAARESIMRRTRERDAPVLQAIHELMGGRVLTLRAICKGLNDRGIPPPKGETWYPNQVRRVLQRKTPTS